MWIAGLCAAGPGATIPPGRPRRHRRDRAAIPATDQPPCSWPFSMEFTMAPKSFCNCSLVGALGEVDRADHRDPVGLTDRDHREQQDGRRTLAAGNRRLGHTAGGLELAGPQIHDLRVLEFAARCALGHALVPRRAELPGVGARIDLDRLTQEDLLAVGQLGHPLTGLLDVPAAGRGQRDPVAQVDRVATRLIRRILSRLIGGLVRWLVGRLIGGLISRLVGRLRRLARRDRDRGRLVTAILAQHHHDAADGHEQHHRRYHDADDQAATLLGPSA